MSALALATLALRIVLALVLGRAAIGKLADRRAARSGAEQLGLPTAIAAPVVAVLPFVELALAAALLISPAAGSAAVAAFVLLTAFTVLIGTNLARGRRPHCNCFGATHAQPIGPLTLARNLVLMAGAGALAGAYLADRSLGAYTDLTAPQAIGLGAGAAFTGLAGATALVLLHLVRQNGRLLERIEALEGARPQRPKARRRATVPIGAMAPDLTASTFAGEPVALGDVRADELPVVLLFVEPRCGACVALGDELALRDEPFSDRRLVIVVHGSGADSMAKFGSIRTAAVLVDPAGATSAAYGVYGTPSAVVVTPDGRLASSIIEGRFDCQRLLDGSADPTVMRDVEVLA
jgi:hypothetical protein